MADITTLVLPDESSYNIKDSSAVASVTYSGHTVTVTLRDGTDSTFDTADTTYSEATTSAAGLLSTDYFDSLASTDTALTQTEVNAVFT